MEICYRPVGQEELDLVLFSAFDRRQNVTDCYRRAEDGSWRICFDPFIDDWTTEDFAFLVQCLRCTVAKGGVVFGAFAAGDSRDSVQGKRRRSERGDSIAI